MADCVDGKSCERLLARLVNYSTCSNCSAECQPEHSALLSATDAQQLNGIAYFSHRPGASQHLEAAVPGKALMAESGLKEWTDLWYNRGMRRTCTANTT